MILFLKEIVFVVCLHLVAGLDVDFNKGFDDNILYKINWPGKIDDLVEIF